MRPTALLVAASALACIGVWLTATGWRQPRPRLETAIRRLERRPTTAPPAPPGRLPGVLDQIGRAIDAGGNGRATTVWSRPLRLIDRRVERHVGLLLASALVGFIAPSLTVLGAQSLGLVELGVFVPFGLAAIGAVVAPLLVHRAAIDRARDVQVDLRHQLSAFLDMVTMLLAGNTGHEGALDQAARAGDGRLFVELRRRMREVSTTGRSLVGALALVADDLGLTELESVASATSLSAAEGAPVARTLAAKCSTLRATLATDQEAAARVRTDKVTPPLVGMALLFMALIVYPALHVQ